MRPAGVAAIAVAGQANTIAAAIKTLLIDHIRSGKLVERYRSPYGVVVESVNVSVFE